MYIIIKLSLVALKWTCKYTITSYQLISYVTYTTNFIRLNVSYWKHGNNDWKWGQRRRQIILTFNSRQFCFITSFASEDLKQQKGMVWIKSVAIRVNQQRNFRFLKITFSNYINNEKHPPVHRQIRHLQQGKTNVFVQFLFYIKFFYRVCRFGFGYSVVG